MILTFLLAVAQPAECKNDGTLIDRRICASEGFARADNELKHQWRVVTKFMQGIDRKREKPRDRKGSYTDALRAAQQAWLSYRDKQCDIESFAYRNGSDEPVLLYNCLERLTSERVQQLRDLEGWYEF